MVHLVAVVAYSSCSANMPRMGNDERYLRLGSPERENDSPKYTYRKVQGDFVPTSGIPCDSCVGVVA
jgi:hypothetical protein